MAGLKGYSFDKIELTAEGVWLHQGVEITHERTRELLFKSVYPKKDQYYLKGEKVPVPIVVEDAAFFVRSVQFLKTKIVISLSDGTKEDLNLSSLYTGKDHALYCLVHDSEVPAKFERKVFYQVMKQLSKKDGYYGIEWDGLFYPIEVVKDLDGQSKAAAKKAVTKKKPVKKKSTGKKKPSVKKKLTKKKATKKKSPAKKQPAKKSRKRR